MNIVEQLEEFVTCRSIARNNGVIKITPEKLRELHAHWASKDLPPVMTFMGCPMQVVNLRDAARAYAEARRGGNFHWRA